MQLHSIETEYNKIFISLIAFYFKMSCLDLNIVAFQRHYDNFLNILNCFFYISSIEYHDDLLTMILIIFFGNSPLVYHY